MVVSPRRVTLGKINKPANTFVESKNDLVVIDFTLREQGRPTYGLTVIKICPLFFYLLNHVLADEGVVDIGGSLTCW